MKTKTKEKVVKAWAVRCSPANESCVCDSGIVDMSGDKDKAQDVLLIFRKKVDALAAKMVGEKIVPVTISFKATKPKKNTMVGGRFA